MIEYRLRRLEAAKALARRLGLRAARTSTSQFAGYFGLEPMLLRALGTPPLHQRDEKDGDFYDEPQN